MRDNRNTLPMWIGGLLLALALIVISNRAGGGLNSPALLQRFAPRPTDPNAPTAQPYQLPQVSLPNLPPALQRAVTSLRDRLAGGEAIPAGAFSFRDSRGVIYATVGSGGTTLRAGQSTSFDLGVPLPPDLGLTLILTLPPDQPLEQILVVETKP